jgi:ATP-dependent Lhr-like helicase
MSGNAFDLLHRGVQEAIWKMAWGELRPIQAEAIRRIFGDRNHLIISAQTAGGKTEAAFLPIISILATDPKPSIQALYVGPLKALINDQFGRLEHLCTALNIPVHRWHGDVAAGRKNELRKSPAGILLITPESLESNFINYGSQIPRIYRHLQFIVIDELHSFLDNVRGVHLRSLLTRLSVTIDFKPRIIGLSATLADTDFARQFVCAEAPERVDVVTDPTSSRELRMGVKAYLKRPAAANDTLVEPRLRPGEILQIIQRLTTADLLRKHPLRKENAPELAALKSQDGITPEDDLDEIADDILGHFTKSTNLIFVNAKATIEILADKLSQLVIARKLADDPFVVHHGSLSKELREQTEQRLKQSIPTTAICSSTLEMGIDIGAVRAVGQLDPPWSVASLVQRSGRSGRREGESAILQMYVRDESPCFDSDLTSLLQPKLLRAVALTRLMLAKWLEPPRTDQLHLSTLIHQVLSCLKQTGGMTAGQLHDILVLQGPFKKVDGQTFTALLRSLGAKEIIEQMPTGELVLAPIGERITASLDFYASFQVTDEYALYHSDEPIGHLPANLIPPPGDLIIFAGRRWRVESVEVDTKKVFLTPTREGRPPRFLGTSGELHPRVAREMRQTLAEADEPVWLDEEGRLLLRVARHIAQQSSLLESPIVAKTDGIQWFPWTGSRCLSTLAALATHAGIRNESDPLSVLYHLDSPQELRAHLQDVVQSHVNPADLAELVSLRSGQKFEWLLSEELANYSNSREQFDLELARLAAKEGLSAMREKETTKHPYE